MKKRIAILLAAVCSFVLCFALVGCGGGKGGDASKNFVGYWKLTGGEMDGEEIDASYISLMESLDLTISLTLNEDGTAKFVLFGDETDSTWEAKDASTMKISVEGVSLEGKLDGGKLSLDLEGEKLIFEKGEAPASSSGTSGTTDPEKGTDKGSTSTTTAKQDLNVTIADDDICTIVVTGAEEDFAGDPGYNMTVTNNSDRSINVYSSYGSFSVGGKMTEAYGSQTVKAGKYADMFLYFMDLDGIEDLVDVDGVIVVVDDESWDTLAEYDFIM